MTHTIYAGMWSSVSCMPFISQPSLLSKQSASFPHVKCFFSSLQTLLRGHCIWLLASVILFFCIQSDKADNLQAVCVENFLAWASELLRLLSFCTTEARSFIYTPFVFSFIICQEEKKQTFPSSDCLYVGHSESNASYFFSVKATTKSTKYYLIEQTPSSPALFVHTVAIISCAFSPAANKSLHATLVNICISGDDPLSLLLKHITHHFTVLIPTVWSPSISISECQWVTFFLHGGMQWHTFASDTLPCQMPFCHTETTCNGILVRRFNLYCRTTNICLWHCGPT